MLTTKYHPILCTPAVAQALHEGRQTQDRRPVKPQPEMVQDYEPEGYSWVPMYRGRELSHRQAPWKPGDVLWVREHIRVTDAAAEGAPLCDPPVFYMADGKPPCDGSYPHSMPATHMPRWAARTFLLVESVRMERIQDISEEDARAEGCASISEFHSLWDALYAKRGLGWDVNPLVWACNLKLTAKPKGWPEV
jgi:hypothetical protein